MQNETRASQPSLRDQLQAPKHGQAVIRCCGGSDGAKLPQAAAPTKIMRAAARRSVLRPERLRYVIEAGVQPVAAPLHDASGAIIAAINISAYPTRVALQVLPKQFLPGLLRTACAVETEMHAGTGGAGGSKLAASSRAVAAG